MPTTAGATRRTCEGSGETSRGSWRRSLSRGAAPAGTGRSRLSRDTAAQRLSARDMRSPRGVLRLVVLPEGSGLDGLPPRLVRAVPLDRRGQRGVEARGGRPAERADLGGVERVAPVVARAIGHRGDEALRLAEQGQDPVRE